MSSLLRMLAVLLSGLLTACGGSGDDQAPRAEAPPATPASDAWDGWNWDEGGFGD
jgi:hypothetical protein